jgi:hypothetical protein
MGIAPASLPARSGSLADQRRQPGRDRSRRRSPRRIARTAPPFLRCSPARAASWPIFPVTIYHRVKCRVIPDPFDRVEQTVDPARLARRGPNQRNAGGREFRATRQSCRGHPSWDAAQRSYADRVHAGFRCFAMTRSRFAPTDGPWPRCIASPGTAASVATR